LPVCEGPGDDPIHCKLGCAVLAHICP
jgi:hypothetical protein